MGSHRRPIRRSIVIRASVFLLLIGGAAIVNIAVAWGCALVLDPYSRITTPFGDMDLRLNDYEYMSSFEMKGCGFHVRAYQPTIHGFDFNDMLGEGPQTPWLTFNRSWWEAREPVSSSATTVFDSRGWPLPAVWSRIDQGARRPCPVSCVYAIQTSYVNATWPWVPKCFPLHPIWPGFAINTLFYAAILWGLFAAPLALRRRRRIKRGLCPKCAYPVGEGPVCTECGTPVMPP